MKYFLSVVVAMLLGTIAGALVGYGVQQAVGQEGWALVIGSLGACAGAFWAGLRRAEDKPFWVVRSRAEVEPVGSPDDTA